jgi:hypothetical protein
MTPWIIGLIIFIIWALGAFAAWALFYGAEKIERADRDDSAETRGTLEPISGL